MTSRQGAAAKGRTKGQPQLRGLSPLSPNRRGNDVFGLRVREGERRLKEKTKTKRKKREHAVLGWQGKGRVRAMDENEINRGAGPHILPPLRASRLGCSKLNKRLLHILKLLEEVWAVEVPLR